MTGGWGNGTTKLAVKIGAITAAILGTAGVFTLLNQIFLAEPMNRHAEATARLVAEERQARQFADSLIIVELRLLRRRDVPAVAEDVQDLGEDVTRGRNQGAVMARRQLEAIHEVREILLNRRPSRPK